MKHYLPICALVVSAALFACLPVGMAGCKSGTAPTAVPAPAPVTKEAPKTPAPTDAQGILKQAGENLLAASSVSSEMLIDAQMGERNYQGTFDIAKYDKLFHISSELGGMSFDFYSDGKNMVATDPFSGRWLRVPSDQKELLLLLIEQLPRKIYIDYIKDASFGADEKIQDKPYQIIEANIKLDALNDLLSSQNNPMVEGMNLKFNNASLKIWLEKDVYLIYKTILNVEAVVNKDIEDEEEGAEPKTTDKHPKTPEEAKPDNALKYSLEINYSDYNKVAPIVIPPEAKSLLDTPSAPNTK